MALEKGTLNGVDIVQDSATPGVPVVDVAANGGDIVAQNAGVLALRRSPTVVDVEADLLTWPTLVDGGSYQCLGFEAVDDGGGKLYTYHLTGRSVLESGPAANRTYWIDGPGGTDYFIDVELKDRFVETTDISRIIQAMLDNEESVILPAGYYYISHPIVFPYKSGAVMRGVARSEVLLGLSDGDNTGNSTRLRYNANVNDYPTEPAITVQGSQHNISNFTLLGVTPYAWNNPGLIPKRTTTGILFTGLEGGEPVDDLGTNKTDLYGVGIYGFETGIQFGLSESEDNCDMVQMNRVVFEHCGSCIWVVTTFAMEGTLEHCEFRNGITNAIRVSGGGHWDMMHCFVASPMTMMYFDGFNSVGRRTGTNNRFWQWHSLKVDAQATNKLIPPVKPGTFHLVDGTHRNGAWVSFEKLQVSTGPNNDAWAEGGYSDGGNFTNTDFNYATSGEVTLATPQPWPS